MCGPGRPVGLHRQRQDLLVPVEFTNCLGMAYRNRKQVGRNLANAGVPLGRHLAQPGVHDRGGTYFDLFAITFVRLGHGINHVATLGLYLVPTRGQCVMFS